MKIVIFFKGIHGELPLRGAATAANTKTRFHLLLTVTAIAGIP